jgi:putative flippase GtrA
MLNRLKPFFSVRFVMFCCVGSSGVLVNLGALAFFADILSVQVNIASALAIWISINTNFVINELWTFRDRRFGRAGFVKRWAKFHLISIIGAAVQWTVFVLANALWFIAFYRGMGEADDASMTARSLQQHIFHFVVAPADVGAFKYLSQLLGVGAATFWNFFANFHWTWKKKSVEDLRDE